MKENWGKFVLADEVLLGSMLQDDVIKTSCDVYATVDIKGQHTCGQMVVDWNSLLKKTPNVTIVTEVHQQPYEKFLMELQNWSIK